MATSWIGSTSTLITTFADGRCRSDESARAGCRRGSRRGPRPSPSWPPANRRPGGRRTVAGRGPAGQRSRCASAHGEQERVAGCGDAEHGDQSGNQSGHLTDLLERRHRARYQPGFGEVALREQVVENSVGGRRVGEAEQGAVTAVDFGDQFGGTQVVEPPRVTIDPWSGSPPNMTGTMTRPTTVISRSPHAPPTVVVSPT